METQAPFVVSPLERAAAEDRLPKAKIYLGITGEFVENDVTPARSAREKMINVFGQLIIAQGAGSQVLAVALISLLCPTVGVAQTPPSGEVVVGYIARATLPAVGIELKVKLDTGADSSSINAPRIEHFTKDGSAWVRFDIVGAAGTPATITRKVSRMVRIKRSGSTSKTRPVIRLNVCVAGVTAVTDFTLADRRQLNYQALIGRKFLKGRLLVDSGRQFIQRKKCR